MGVFFFFFGLKRVSFIVSKLYLNEIEFKNFPSSLKSGLLLLLFLFFAYYPIY